MRNGSGIKNPPARAHTHTHVKYEVSECIFDAIFCVYESMATRLAVFVTVFSLLAVLGDAAVVGDEIARANRELSKYLSLVKNKTAPVLSAEEHRVR